MARVAGHSLAQLLVIVGCVAWLASGKPAGILANGFSIGAFVLAQVLLNQQRRRERALQLKVDELVLSHEGARDEIAGVETLSEREIAGHERRDPD
ncbi:MAG: low affinity iron permease family protein [Sphingomonadaceae bacterium]|nr:low affinity iron permease family protein [Sphingomonadaceae bacterium]